MNYPVSHARFIHKFGLKLAIALSIAVLLCVASIVQKTLLAPLSLGPRASLFYLPAAVITLGSLVSPLASLGGIFAGALVFNLLTKNLPAIPDVILVSLVPALAAMTAVAVTYFLSPRFRDFHHVQGRYSQIDAINIFYFCCLYALANVALTELLYQFEIHAPVSFPPVMILGMMFGDLSGSFLVFVLLNLLFSLYLRLR